MNHNIRSKFGVKSSIIWVTLIAVIWIVVYIALMSNLLPSCCLRALSYSYRKWILKFFLCMTVLLLGFYCVYISVSKIKHYWNKSRSNIRMKVYNLSLTSISLYSILLLGAEEHYQDFLYGGFIIIAATVSMSIICNEMSHYFPSVNNNSDVEIMISKQSIYDKSGHKFIIPKQNIKAIKHSK